MALQVDVYPAAIAPAKNPVVFRISADIGVPAKVNLKIGLKLYRRVSGTDVLIFEDLKSTYLSGGRQVALFDISELLMADLRSDFNLYTTTAYHDRVVRPNILLPFYIKYYEEYGDPAAVDVVKISRWFYSLNGGIPAWKQVLFFNSYSNIVDYFTDTARVFLTWYWFEKLTDINAPEKLYFIVPDTPENFTGIRVTRHYFDDGDEYEDINFDRMLQVGYVYEIDASYRSVIRSHTSMFSGYSVKLINAAAPTWKSEEFHFKMDYRIPQKVHYFMFLNSLGAFECIRLIGYQSVSNAYTRQYYEQTALEELSVSSAAKGQIDPDVKRTFKASSNWMCREEAIWLQEFIGSPEIYEIIDDVRYPVLIIQDKVELIKDSGDVISVLMEFEYVDITSVYQKETTVAWEEISVISPPYSED